MDLAVEKKKIGYKDILMDKNFCLFIIGNLISRFGDSIDTIAYGWMVYEITGSTALMALIFGVNAIPTILFQPIAGVFVDYKKKKNVVVICNLGRATVVTITALMFIFGILRPYHLFIFTFMNSTFESFEGPAAIAAYPLIIEKEKFAYARAVQSTLSRIVELVGLAVAAGIIAVIGIGGGMIVNAVSFFLCGIFMAMVRYKEEILKKQQLNMKGYFVDLKDGFIYLKTSKILMSITIFAALINLFMIPFNTLGVAYVNEELLKGPEVVAMISFSLTTGMLIGGAIYPKIAEKFKGINLFIISGVILGTAYLSLAFVPMIGVDLVLYGTIILLAFLFGASASIFMMIVNITFMQKTEQQYLGRAAGILNSLCMAATPVGSLVVGSLCVFLSTAQLFLIFGIGMVVLFLCQRYNKSMQEI
ncbi:MFS transporter [uncultured Clostridium sp.]|uniref:MFS transporter n=1 Tax=uncultured Clostridium sp. TaxID=59620 RepID=UPI00321649CF